MRTQQEILDRIEAVKGDDFFGFQQQDLIVYLDYENAKPYLKEGVEKDEWEKLRATRSPWGEMVQYMDFAWGKANGKRGLSAARSMEHYHTWLWLAENDELSESISSYRDYGKPQLTMICEYLGLNAEDYKDN